jgi:hypothetical protein
MPMALVLAKVAKTVGRDSGRFKSSFRTVMKKPNSASTSTDTTAGFRDKMLALCVAKSFKHSSERRNHEEKQTD